MHETLELGQIALLLWGRKGQVLVSLTVIIYLFGVLVSKGIIVGTTMRYL